MRSQSKSAPAGSEETSEPAGIEIIAADDVMRTDLASVEEGWLKKTAFVFSEDTAMARIPGGQFWSADMLTRLTHDLRRLEERREAGEL